MWVFLNNAFVSIVENRNKPGELMVRARAREDLERLFPNREIVETPTADYRFRTFQPKSVVAGIIALQVHSITYGNFKGSIAADDTKRHDAYLGVWGVMSRAYGAYARPRYEADLFGWGDVEIPGWDDDDAPAGPGVGFSDKD